MLAAARPARTAEVAFCAKDCVGSTYRSVLLSCLDSNKGCKLSRGLPGCCYCCSVPWQRMAWHRRLAYEIPRRVLRGCKCETGSSSWLMIYASWRQGTGFNGVRTSIITTEAWSTSNRYDKRADSTSSAANNRQAEAASATMYHAEREHESVADGRPMIEL